MVSWKILPHERPQDGDRVIVCFWWGEMEDYNMMMGSWPLHEILEQDYGKGCLVLQWTEAPDYPEDLP